ncbi:hypothetical protein K3495_g12547 [Podosphaera aphanis]|nr:hypothetical protein K3495_g12547 [Podosphaera aphanis]
MGTCSSCLGYDTDRDLSDEDEQSRLLFDNAISHHYGSFGDLNPRGIYADEEELQRATEALQIVLSQTSNHLVDIFATGPQKISPSTMAHLQDSRILRYKEVVARNAYLNLKSEIASEAAFSKGKLPVSDEWTSEEENSKKVKKFHPVTREGAGSFLGQFSDPKSAE